MPVTVRTNFVPLAPIRLIKPTGHVVSQGITADSDDARGAVFETLLAQAGDGDTLEVSANCSISVAPRKNGVRIVPLNGAVITNTAILPAILPNDFPSTATNLINRRRRVEFYAPEPEFCFYHHDFSTSVDAGETVFSTTNGTRDQGQGEFHFTTPSGGSGYLLAKKRFQGSAQLTSKVRINSLNATGSYNDIAIGFAVTSTPTSDVVTDKILAYYRLTGSGASILLSWTYGGGNLVYDLASLAAPLTTPFDLILILNHGSIALAVDENGRQRILMNKEINEGNGFLSLEDETNVAKLRPMLFWQSSGAIDANTGLWEVRANGSLGHREHYPATYENGEPIRNSEGLIYVTADATNVTTVRDNGPIEFSEYDKNQSTTMLYSQDTGRFIRNTAKYCIRDSGKVFGAQQGKVMYDRRTGLYHYYSAIWNEGSTVQMMHYATYDNLLHSYWVLDSDQFDIIDLTGFGHPFTATGVSNGQYDTDIIKHNGRWYLAGTVGANGSSAYGRTAFCVSGTSPTDFDTLEFVDDATDEGTRIWRIAGVPYIATSPGSSGNVKIMDLTGTTVHTIAGMITAGYSTQASLMPVVKGGRTQYQVIAFTDSARPASPGTNKGGDDYEVDYTGEVQSLTFGATAVWDLGTWGGEEFTNQPRM